MSFTQIIEDAVREMIESLPLRKTEQRTQVYALTIHMLCQAKRNPVKYNGIDLKRGQLICKIRTMGEPYGLSHQKTRTVLSILENAGVITQITTHLFSVVTFCDFDTYVHPEEGKQHTSQHGDNTVITHHTHEHYKEGRGKSTTSTVEPEVRPASKDRPSKEQQLRDLCNEHPWVPETLKANWTAHAELPKSSQTPSAKLSIAQTILRLNTIDEWTQNQIGQILHWGSTVWCPKGMIGSPASLRDWTAKGDRKVSEAIWAQIKQSSGSTGPKQVVTDWHPSSPFDMPPLQINQ